MNQESDRELIEKYLSGDDDSLTLLIDRHLNAVYKFVHRYLGPLASETDDIVQEAFIKAWQNLEKFDRSRNFRIWLFAIAKNTAIDFLKKKKPLLLPFIEAEDAKEENRLKEQELRQDDSFLEQADVKFELEEALKKMPASYRLILSLRYNDHLKFREIAEALGEPLNTVKSKHQRGIRLLQNLLSKD